MPTWEDVVEIGRRLPGVEVGTSFRTPALRVRGKGMCRLRTSPAALVLRVSDDGRGIDVARVRAAAVRRELFTPDQAEALPDDQALRLNPSSAAVFVNMNVF